MQHQSSLVLSSRMTSLPLYGITFAQSKYTSFSRSSRVVSEPCMRNYSWGKEERFEKLCSKRNMHRDGNVRVFLREQVGTPLEKRQVLQNEKTEERVTGVSDGLGIAGFIRGKIFLITGATGFLAKVLVERILNSVPDVGKIYLLIKAKDKEAAMQRLKSEIMNTDLFKSVRETHGKSHQAFILSKLVPVVGNIGESSLGMDPVVYDNVANEVDIIINSAGNTTFDGRFDGSIDTNTLGPSRILSFSRKCKNLKLFLHVSTAYVNGGRQGVIMEKPFYNGDSLAREKAASEKPTRSFPLLDIKAEVKRSLDLRKGSKTNCVDQNMKNLGLERARKFGWHDTYVFTKAMGEMVIESERGEIPAVIVRPSIIESTYKAPFPGWIEGIRVMDPMLVYYAKGMLTGFPVDATRFIDIVPVDMVVNAIIAATVKHATISKPGLSVYQMTSSVVNPLSLHDLFSFFYDYFESSPYKDAKKGAINVKKMKLFKSMDEFNSHIQTEAVERSADTTQKRNQSRWSRKVLEIATYLGKIYEPYMFYEGRFDSSNTRKLLEEMSEEEKRCFGFDVAPIVWKDYWCNIHVPGLMTHVLKGRGM